MSNITEQISELLLNKAPPFLFVGAGLSRRYLQIENWEELLRRFTKDLKEYEYYKGKSAGDLPTTASLIVEDFYDHWWNSSKYKDSREISKALIKEKSSALKIEITNYLKSKVLKEDELSKELQEEIKLLREAQIDGVITTNWDQLLESLFPDYKPYIGQNKLLFSSPNEIAEIYKIHGCITEPNSLVLSQEDYLRFSKDNPYLIAKLLTVFVEHPVLFLGYSFTDTHIHAILNNLAKCLGTDNISKLHDNLIFVDYSLTEKSCARTVFKIEDSSIPVTLIRTNDFRPIFKALTSYHRKVPAKTLRWIKEHLYEIVKTNDPKGKIFVSDIEDEGSLKDADVVLGIGVKTRFTQIGYRAIGVEDLVKDVLNKGNYDPEEVLAQTLPSLKNNRGNFPIFKYLVEVGITSMEDFNASNYVGLDSLQERIKRPRKWYAFNAKEYGYKSKLPVSKALSLDLKQALYSLTYANWEEEDLPKIYEYLLENIHCINSTDNNLKRSFNKCVFLYDYYLYGHWS